MQTQFYVYKITNKINNKIYIGKANDPEVRWKKHLYTAKYGEKKYGFQYIHAAIKKYGVENFIFEIIGSYPSEDDAFNAEMHYIAELKSKNRNFGYNLTDGGEGPSGRVQSEEEKKKRAESIISGNYRGDRSKHFGKKHTEEHKKNISEGNKGKILSPEIRQHISESKMGNKNGMYGRPQSFENRKERGIKVSETKSKKDNSNKPVSTETIEKLKLAVKENKSRLLADEQKNSIIELYDTGNYIKRDLAAQFDTDEKTIRYVIRYWPEVKNNKSKYLTDERKGKIISMYLSKEYTYQQIANTLNLHFNRIEAVIKVYQRKANKIA
jgi:group I intron endonuclease